MSKKGTGRPTGRPTSYDHKYCEMILDYFSIPVMKVTKKKLNGREIEVEEINPPPTKYGFAMSIGVHSDTLNLWCKQYPEFLSAFKRAHEMQAEFIISAGFRGLCNTAFSIFMMKNNHGWTDRTEQVLTVGKSLEELIRETKEQKNKGVIEIKGDQIEHKKN